MGKLKDISAKIGKAIFKVVSTIKKFIIKDGK